MRGIYLGLVISLASEKKLWTLPSAGMARLGAALSGNSRYGVLAREPAHMDSE